MPSVLHGDEERLRQSGLQVPLFVRQDGDDPLTRFVHHLLEPRVQSSDRDGLLCVCGTETQILS